MKKTPRSAPSADAPPPNSREALAPLLLPWAILVTIFFAVRAKWQVAESLDAWLRSDFHLVPTAAALKEQALAVMVVAGLSVIFVATGSWALRLIGARPRNACEGLAMRFGLGYGAWGTALLLAGLSIGWSRLHLQALFGGALLLSIWLLRGLPRPARAQEIPPPELHEKWMFGVLLAAWLSSARWALIPETFYDALQYHLALPSLYLNHGGILAVPENSYAGIPSIPQMAFGWTLALDPTGLSASLLHCATAIWLALAMVGLCEAAGSRSAGIIASAAFFTTPLVAAELFRTSVNLEWTLMQFLYIASLLTALGRGRGDVERTAWLALGGVFMGLAMATKYPALLLPLSLAAAFALEDREARLTLKEAGLVVLFAGLGVAPWIIKNLFHYSNPLHPFFHEFFSTAPDFLPRWRQLSSGGWDSGLGDISHFMGLVPLCLAPLLALSTLGPREKVLGWMTLLLVLPLAVISRHNRLFMPHLAPLIALIFLANARLASARVNSGLKTLACLLVSATAALWLILTATQERGLAFTGKTPRADYLGHEQVSYPSPPYAGIEYLNRESPPDSKVLFHGDSRTFHLRRRAFASSTDQTPLLELWAEKSADASGLRKIFEEHGISHILVNSGELIRLRRLPESSERGLAVLDRFWRRYTLPVHGVFEPPRRWVGVYKVLSEEEASRPHPSDEFIGTIIKKASP